MPKIKALNDFLRMSDAKLIAKGNSVAAGLTGNPKYPKIIPTAITLSTDTGNFNASVVAASTKDKVKIAEKNSFRIVLLTTLKGITAYVNANTPQDDLAAFLSTNLTISGSANTPVVLGAPENFTVEVGNTKGTATARCSRMPAGKIYIFMYQPVGSTTDAWVLGITDQLFFVFNDIEVLKAYTFKVAIAGLKGKVVYSEPVVKTIT